MGRASGPAWWRASWPALLLIVACLLSVITVQAQVARLGVPYVSDGGTQLQRHRAIVEGVARNPQQYRVLSELLVEGLDRLLVPRGVRLGSFDAHAVAFLLFRVMQNCVIFVLAGRYYRALGLNPFAMWIGLALLAFAMTTALFDSDLSFNLYSDVIAYLAAALLIATRRDVWLVPLTAVAALNRETSALIPLMLLVARLPCFDAARLFPRAAKLAAAALLAYAAVFVGLRIGYGPRELDLPYGHHPGLDLLTYNVARLVTWMNLATTLSILPVVAVASYRVTPPVVRAFGWALVPTWVAAHLVGAVAAETRLFLVPLAVVIIPGALSGIQAGSSKAGIHRARGSLA